QLPLRFVGIEPGERFEALLHLLASLLQLSLALLNGALPVGHLLSAHLLRLQLLIVHEKLTVERLLAFLETALGTFDLVPASRLLALPLLLGAESFLLTGEDLGLSEVLGILLGGGDDAGGLVFRSRTGALLASPL